MIFTGFEFGRHMNSQGSLFGYVIWSLLLVVHVYVTQIFGMQVESVKQTARLIYQTALMESGFMLNDPKDFASSIYSSVKASLNISPDAVVEEEEDAEEEVQTEVKESPEGDNVDAAKYEAETESSFKDEL